MVTAPPDPTIRRVLDPHGPLDPRGGVLPDREAPAIPDSDLVRMLEVMLLVRVLDERMARLAQGGRIGFHVAARGQEACHLAVYPLRATDWVFPSLRDHGAWFWRGHSLADYIHQLFGDEDDPLRGRQMPAHHSSRAHRMVSVSSLAGTQIPHATGTAHAARLTGKDDVVMAFFGGRTVSAGDFHVGLNFAGVFQAPVVFLCRGSEDSTLMAKAMAYGVHGARVDGSDLLAVLEVAGEAVARARAGEGPTLIEAVSTGDGDTHAAPDSGPGDPGGPGDPCRPGDPVARFRRYLTGRSLWSADYEKETVARHHAAIDALVARPSARRGPPRDSLFDDVYQELPWNLVEQRAYLADNPARRDGGRPDRGESA